MGGDEAFGSTLLYCPLNPKIALHFCPGEKTKVGIISDY